MPDFADAYGQSGATVLTPAQYAAYFGGGGQQSGSQPSAPVTTLASQVGASGLNLTGTSGGGEATPIGGQTQALKLSDGTTVLIDTTTGAVVSQYGTPEATPSQLQSQKFSHEESMQSQSEASAAARQAQQDASAERRQASSEASAERRQQNDPQNDPWRQMMPKYVAPSGIQGERGALDILDPNTGQLMSVRQPGPPPVRIAGGNLIVDPGANAAVYYNGNQGRATHISGGPQMLNRGASFPSAMSQAQQIAGMIQNKGQGGASAGSASMGGSMGGSPQGGGMGGGGGYGGMGGGGGAGNRFVNPGGGPGAQRPPVSNQFAAPGPQIQIGDLQEVPNGISIGDLQDVPPPPQWVQPEPLDPFGPDMNYDFGYGV